MMQQTYYQQPDEEVPLRREMSHRKAKGRSVLQLLNMSIDTEDFAGAASDEEPAEFQDSDTDPVWTPEVDEDDEEWDKGRKKLKKPRDARTRMRKLSQGGTQEGEFLPMRGNVQEEVISLDMEATMGKESVIQMHENLPQKVPQVQPMQQQKTPQNHEGFKIGQFLVNIQDEVTHEWPKLWRVDGKNLLEKYEPILKAGKIVYRNESVFAALLPDSHGNYRVIKVATIQNTADFRTRQNNLVEWIRDGVPSPVKPQMQESQSTSHQGVIRENPTTQGAVGVIPQPAAAPLVDLGPEVMAQAAVPTTPMTPFERLMQEKLVYQEHFEIYIQTLISQLLNMSIDTEDFAGAASDEEPAEFQDSDTDPVWTPEVDEDDEEWDKGRKKLKKPRDARTRMRKLSQGGTQEGEFLPMRGNVQEEVISLDMEATMGKESVIQMHENLPQKVPQVQPMQQQKTPQNHEGFKIGQFLVNIQDEVTHEWPKLWRVDGKNLLEKYEPILKAGKIVYRNESVFAALLPDSHGNYRVIKVATIQNTADFRTRQNNLVEWIRDGVPSPVKPQMQESQSTSHQGVIRENPTTQGAVGVIPQPAAAPLVDLGPEVMAQAAVPTTPMTPFERLMQEKLVYQEHFEIYIQTLISQALDPNFLTEIIQENDEYFLGSVRTIDSLIEGLRTRLRTARPISRNFHAAVETWPQYDVLQLGPNYPPQMACTSCLRAVAAVHIRFAGQLYNPVTMTARDFQAGVSYERDFTLCGACNENLRMHHRLSHQKYSLFMACTQKVQERGTQEPGKTSTTILNELLAEDSWLEELFRNVRQGWVEIEMLVDGDVAVRF
uniref:DUF4211 domain-containing protein n=2 Tax=Lutzomyia longipalpis TaxID=7200 RepID=A0A1B0C828_LUTLO